MTEPGPSNSLSVLLGALRQEARDGELVLEQNDGVRRFYLRRGELVHLTSEAAGEKFGSYLLRRGILEFPVLKELLASPGNGRLGARVIDGGMMSPQERDGHLRAHQEQILVNALEHPVLCWTWNPGDLDARLSADLQFELQHRQLIWRSFQEQEADALGRLVDILESQPGWRWEGRWDLLEALSDLPLTPGAAYALSFLTADPISFDTFRSLTNQGAEEAARFICALWALGGLVLAGGALPLTGGEPLPAPEPLRIELDGWPERAGGTRGATPARLPATPARLPAAPAADPELDPSSANVQPEFIDLESDSAEIQEDYDPADRSRQDEYDTPSRPRPDDLPPCGPRLRPDDLSPSGPRPQPPPPATTPSTPARPMNFIELDQDGAEPPRTEIEPPPEAPQPAPGGSRSPAGPPPRPRTDPFDVEPPPAYYDPESELASGSHRARKLLAQARHQAQLNRTIEAVQTLEQVVRLPLEGETAYEAWLMLGRLRSANPAWSARAFQALQTACRIHPREAEPWAAMGELHRRQGDEPQALVCYRKALALNPSQPVPVDLDLRETPRPAPAAKPPAKGLLGSFRALLGRRG